MMQNFQTERDEMNMKMDQVDSQNTILKKQTDNQKAQINDLQHQISSLESDIRSLQREKGRASNDLQDLECQLDQSKLKNKNLSLENSNLLEKTETQ